MRVAKASRRGRAGGLAGGRGAEEGEAGVEEVAEGGCGDLAGQGLELVDEGVDPDEGDDGELLDGRGVVFLAGIRKGPS
jgi:hypothetical protein